MSNLYREIILEHWRHPHNFGRISKLDSAKLSRLDFAKFRDASKRSSVFNPSCGDEIALEILFQKGRAKEVKFIGSGCAISQASASLMTDHLKGKTLTEVKRFDEKTALALLKTDIGFTRRKCALLPWQALQLIIRKNGKE